MNAVGYDQTTLREGFKGAGASFVSVGGGDIDLVDLKVTGYEETDGYCEGSVQCQFLDKDGYGGEVYFWYDIPDELYGWLDGSDTPVAEYEPEDRVTFKPGEGLWVSSDFDGFSIQNAGQVADGSTLVKLREGFKMIVNPNPTTCELSEVWVTGYEGDGYCEGSVQCQFLDKDGYGGEVYFWYDIPDELYGWLDGSDTPIAEYEEGDRIFVEAGVGIWVSSDFDGFDINFPNPLEK